MANFTSFARGEPIDVTSLGKMSDFIVQVNNELLAARQSKSSIFDIKLGTWKTVDTSDVAIWTGKVFIISGTTPNPDNPAVNWHADFHGVSFTHDPIVTATPYCDTDTGSGPGTIAPSCIWIQSITPTQVKGKWRWVGTTKRVETVYAMVTAIGEGTLV